MVAVFSSVQFSSHSAGPLRLRPHEFVSLTESVRFLLLFGANTPAEEEAAAAAAGAPGAAQQQQEQEQPRPPAEVVAAEAAGAGAAFPRQSTP